MIRCQNCIRMSNTWLFKSDDFWADSLCPLCNKREREREREREIRKIASEKIGNFFKLIIIFSAKSNCLCISFQDKVSKSVETEKVLFIFITFSYLFYSDLSLDSSLIVAFIRGSKINLKNNSVFAFYLQPSH